MRNPGRSGFTLIELMITVGIIGLLCSIAIPGFLRFQLRSKVTEATLNLRAIAKAETSYFGEHGMYVSAPTPVPPAIPGNDKVAWPGSSEFGRLGWSPEGSVHFSYRVGADDGPRFTAEAGGDVDGDGQRSFFAFVRPSTSPTGVPGGLPGALPDTTCDGSGVHSPGGGGNVFDVPGPCDPDSGIDVF